MEKYQTKPAERKPEACSRCQSINFQEREKGPHLGRFCADCGAWLRWLSRREAGNFRAVPAVGTRLPEPPKNDQRRIAYPVTLEDRVSALEHDLGIIAQLLVGKKSGGSR